MNRGLRFRMYRADSRLVRAIFEANGFRETTGSEWSCTWAGSHLKPYMLQCLQPWQKVLLLLKHTDNCR